VVRRQGPWRRIRAVTAADRSIVLLHRVRDELGREIRAWDATHEPYDDRD
jgi:hypothetical protein